MQVFSSLLHKCFRFSNRFDVAGAGACLKRYTDPSFFQVELLSSRMTTAETQREKKIRKAKKKGSRWRNGVTPEVLTTSHAKLHQLFMKERVENGVSDPARRVKLKRRLNGFPFDSKSGESYMQNFLKDPSPEQKLVHETYGASSLLKLPWNATADSGLEIHEISTVSSDKESIRGRNSLSSSPNMEEIAPTTLRDHFSQDVDTTSFMLQKAVEDKEILVDSGSKVEETFDGYQSDDIASEMDNYSDALTTMDSEVETETELKAKNFQGFLNTEKPGTDSDANVEQLHVHFSDSQSIGNSTASDDGFSSSKKGIFSSSSDDSSGMSADNVPSYGECSPTVYPSTEICEAEAIDKSSGHVSFYQGVSLTQPPENGLSADVSIKVDEKLSCRDEFSEQFSILSLADRAPTILHSDLGSTMRKDKLAGEQMDEALSSCDKSNTTSINCLENGTILLEYSCNGSNLSDKTGDFSPLSSKRHSLNEIDSEGPNAFSVASIHFSNILDEAYCTKIAENSSYIVLNAKCLEKYYAKNFIQNLSSQPHSVVSTTERKPFSPILSEIEPCRQDAKDEAIISEMEYDVPFNGNMETSLVPVQDIPHMCDLTKSQVLETVNDDVTLRNCSAEVNDTYSEKQFGSVNAEEVGETIPTIDMVETVLSPNPASLSEFHEVLESEAVVSASVLAFPDNDADSSSLNLRELHASSFGVLDQTEVDISDTNLPENHEESIASEQASPPAVSLDFNSFQCNTVCSGHYEPQAHNNIPESNMSSVAQNSLNPGVAILVPSSLDDSDQVSESKSNAQCNATENAEEESSLALNQQAIASPDLNLSDESGDNLVQSSLEDSGQVTGSNSNLLCNATDNAECVSSLVLNQQAIASPDLNLGDGILVKSALEDAGLDSKSISDQQGNTIENATDVSSSMLNLQAIALSDLDLFHTVSTGHSELQLLNVIPKSSIATQVECSLSLDDATPVSSSSEESGHGSQLKHCQGNSTDENIEGASLLTSVEPRILVDQKVNLEDDQIVMQAPQESSPIENVDDSSLPTLVERSFQVEQTLKLQADRFDMKSPQLDENMRDVSPLPAFTEQRISTEKEVILQSDQLDVKSHVAETNLESFSHSGYGDFLNHVGPKRPLDISSECHPVDFPIQFSVPELIPQPGRHKVNIQQSTGPLTSIFPVFGMLSGKTQTTLEEMPPLPPLPPLQWRMGKLQGAPKSLDRDAVQNQMDSLEHMRSSTPDYKAQIQGEISQASNPFLSHLPEKREISQHVYEVQGDMLHSSHLSLQIPMSVNCGYDLGNSLTSGNTHLVNPFSTLPGAFSVMQQHEGERIQTSLNPFSSGLAPGNTASTFAISSSQDKVLHSLHQVAPEASFDAERPVQNSNISEGTVINSCDFVAPSQIIQEGQPLHVFPMLAEESVISAVDEGNINESQPTKLPRPRNPLIDAVIAHDKSKLRKVTERVQPEVPKVEETDSLLEQIRAKSFNLKPAAVNRPNIQGPKTNLKVSAILEKANAIRQALAGSDEDDDDNWSDS